MSPRAIAALAPLVLAMGACSDNETAIARGDRLWADSNFIGARAEYRLAAAQRGDDDALARLAHAYARTGDMDAAREAYDELLDHDPGAATQAAADYVRFARRALERSDEYGLAQAVEAAREIQPELHFPEFEVPLARYYTARGDTDLALEHYRRALLVLPPDSAPPLLYEMGLILENREECREAIEMFEGARHQARRAGSSEHGGRWRQLVTEARWHVGNCSFVLAQQAWARGRVTEALEHFETMIALGEPENLLDQAWFDRGEILYGIGRFDEALAAYRRVVDRNPARTGQLVERATRRIDEIRFSVPVDTTAPGAPGLR